MKSYSQFGQDLWVLSLYPDIQGFFVDIGCCDGERISNTFLLEQSGWKGIAADPCPTNFSHRKNTILESVAIFSHETVLPFALAGDIGGFSEYLDTWKNDHRVTNAKIVEQPTITLAQLLRKHNAPRFIHYLSLDTEGSEYEILKTFPFDEYRFGCITVEHNREEPKRSQIINLLKDHGYSVAKQDDWEDYFVTTG